MEAKRTFSPSKLDMQTGEVCISTEGTSVQKRLSEEDTTETNPSLRQEQSEVNIKQQNHVVYSRKTVMKSIKSIQNTKIIFSDPNSV